ncbi:hypothetical protein TCE0_022f06332 [Talaromyces pinophilus]|uniref:Aminoacyl-transfer RNA synthetases class-II family profile domain-containing protein n=1 Tax=Talaromyces pinophilus TaxID=128442 RepID=A0A6V8H9S8_TALPI|nr:hypothetical protein TCE0_022f06332 [Talaromyces pinophilus]
MLAASLRQSTHALRTSSRQSYLEIWNFARQRGLGRAQPVLPLVGRRNNHHESFKPLQQTPDIENITTPLERYKNAVDFPKATHTFSSLLQNASPGDTVVLHGYLGNRADISKKLSFVRLTDPTMRQNVQIISSAKNEVHQQLKSLSSNTPVAIRGTVQAKKGNGEGEREGPDVEKIDSLEISLTDIWLLNEFSKDIIMTAETVFPAEQRHLQLRSDRGLREALRFRSEARKVCREELENMSLPFIEIETPLLFKSTPEGAREFIVPTRRKGLAYALPQSPQQYKQILMASGIPRYYQFARCFRDEDLRTDRQPEFTQLDLEMSFATGEDVMKSIEKVIRKLWSSLLCIDLGTEPFMRMPYQEAMGRFGSDKPDTRLGMEIVRLDYMLPVDLVQKITPLTDPIVEAFKLESEDNDPAKTLELVTRFLDSPAGAEFNKNPDGGPGIFVYDAKKPLRGLMPFGFEAAERVEELLEPDHGDLIVLQARKNAPFSGGSTPLGDLRKALYSEAVKAGVKEAPKGFNFLWIVDFPLFSPIDENEPGQGGTAGLASTHHPFTAPKSAADVDLMVTDPAAVVADHYDLVVNGVELGGGSRRIHDARVQEIVFRDILKMPASRLTEFSHLLEALKAGCPPHAGIALGFDRLIAIMLGKESVRDVIAFPKSGKGEDVMPILNADSDDNEDLWKLAYNELKNQDPELVKDYGRKVLSLKCIDPNTSNPSSSPGSIQDIVSALAKAHEDKQWQVTLGSRQIKVRAQVEKLITFALGCESIVEPAAKSHTWHWPGQECLCFFLLLSDSLEQAEVMLDGFNYTCDKQRYWRIYEKGVYQIPLDILKPLVKLYAQILKYQVIVISHLSKTQVQRAWNSRETWEEMQLKVESPTQALRDDINLVIQSRTEELTHFDDGERQEIVRLFEEKENSSPPLHIKVLNVALTLAIGSEKIKTYEDIYKNLYKSDFYDNILRNLSELFLVIREDYVYFIHRTARDFMLINNSADCRSNRQWKGSLNEEDAHGLMWNIRSILQRLCPKHKLSEPLGEFDVYYTGKNWANHYRRQSAQA